MPTEEKVPWNGSKGAWWKRTAPIWIPIAAAIAGGLLGGPGYRALEDPRRLPFTSRDAEVMEARLVSKIEGGDYQIRLDDGKIEKRVDGLYELFTALSSAVMLLPPDTLLERMTRAEEQIKHLDKVCIRKSRLQ